MGWVGGVEPPYPLLRVLTTKFSFLVSQVSEGNLGEVGIGGSGRRRRFLNGCYMDDDDNSRDRFW